MNLRLSPPPLLRWPLVAALAVIAGIHVSLVPEHLREAPYAGVLFIALSVAAITTAVLLAVCNHPFVGVAAAALSLAAVLGYVISRSIGLPLLGDDLGDWLNPLGDAALGCEIAVIVICVVKPPGAVGRPAPVSSPGSGSTRG